MAWEEDQRVAVASCAFIPTVFAIPAAKREQLVQWPDNMTGQRAESMLNIVIQSGSLLAFTCRWMQGRVRGMEDVVERQKNTGSVGMTQKKLMWR